MALDHRRRLILLGAAAAALLLLALGSSARAMPLQQDPTPTPANQPADTQAADPSLNISDGYCLSCHGQPGLTYVLQNGDVLGLYIPPEDHLNSVHGKAGYACVQCHRTTGEYPHAPFSAVDSRDTSLRLYQACRYCHAVQYDLAQDSVHARAFANGIREAAICTDCHTAHQVRRVTDPQTGENLPDTRLWAAETCAKCHSLIFQKYKTSVHGSALIGEGNPDVPSCIDCHGVHNIEDPTTSAFRVGSPDICARCHTDSTIMNKYGISTEVLNTYVADFHGTTVELFKKQSPDAETNKPVCYDCHGIHDIQKIDDPNKGLQVKQNLLARCQECHPDATTNFPDAWLSHYIPSADKTPAVYYINLFYQFLIPTLVGGFAVLVGLDLGRLSLNRYRASRARARLEPEAQGPEKGPDEPKEETPDSTADAATHDQEAADE
jgi:hypothetical protein